MFRLRALLVFAGFILASMNAARATSFDCTKAARPLEQLICSDPALRAQDDKMAALYSSALTKVSDGGKRILRDGQRQWLQYIQTVCANVDGNVEGPKEAVRCLRNEYEQRLRALSHAAVRIGPYIFLRVERFKVTEGPSSAKSDPWRFTTARMAYPRIDHAMSAGTKHWNDLAARRAERIFAGVARKDTDASLGYEIPYASHALISVAFTPWFYPHHAAHGNYSTIAFNVPSSTGKEIGSRDLFRPQSGWQRFLATRAFHDLERQSAEKDWRLFLKSPNEISKIVAKPERWLFSHDGLSIHFNIYEVAAYVEGPKRVVIPWHDLKPYLLAQPSFLVPPP